jgi:hypothetical protein
MALTPQQQLPGRYTRLAVSIGLIAGFGLGGYVFVSNQLAWWARLAWSAVEGLVVALVIPTALLWLIESVLQLCHLASVHRQEFIRGGWLGLAGGAILGTFLWDHSFSLTGGSSLVITTAMISGLATATAGRAAAPVSVQAAWRRVAGVAKFRGRQPCGLRGAPANARCWLCREPALAM